MNANGKYTPSIIAQDTTNRFVTDSQINNWTNNRTALNTINGVITDIGWYRIAQSQININQNQARFEIATGISGIGFSNIGFDASIVYGSNPTITQNIYSLFGTPAITQVRIVYNTNYSGASAYIEIYNSLPGNTIVIDMINTIGWSLCYPEIGSIPSGYDSISIEFKKGIKTTDNVEASAIIASSDIKVGNYTLNYNNNTQSIEFLFN
jgi:hypothetical protein